MSLSYWSHPQTGSPRLYIHQSILKNAGIKLGEGGKVWFEPAPNQRGWKIGSKAVEAESKSEIQKRVLAELELEAPSWDELQRLTETGGKGQRRTRSAKVSPDASRAGDARRLNVASIKMPAAVTIEVDHREPELLSSILDTHEQITLERVSLELSDFRVTDHEGNELLIERKRCAADSGKSDFEASLVNDGRLFDQSERLKLSASNSDHQVIPVVLLEGDVYAGAPELLVQQIDGALSFLSAVQRISVLCSYNANHSAYLIAKLASHFVDGLYQPVTLHKRKPRALDQQQLYVLESLPGVSSVLAEELLQHFGCLKNVFTASPEALSAVPGMGPKKIKAVQRVATGEI